MSLRELETKVVELTPDERWHLAAFIRFLEQKDDPELHRQLAEADARLKAGQGVTLEELRRKLALPAAA